MSVFLFVFDVENEMMFCMEKIIFFNYRAQIPKFADSRTLPSRQSNVESGYMEAIQHLKRIIAEVGRECRGTVNFEVIAPSKVKLFDARRAGAAVECRVRFGLRWWLARKLSGRPLVPEQLRISLSKAFGEVARA